MKMKNRIVTRYCFVSINTLQRVMTYIYIYMYTHLSLSIYIYYWLLNKHMNADMLQKAPQKIIYDIFGEASSSPVSAWVPTCGFSKPWCFKPNKLFLWAHCTYSRKNILNAYWFVIVSFLIEFELHSYFDCIWIRSEFVLYWFVLNLIPIITSYWGKRIERFMISLGKHGPI